MPKERDPRVQAIADKLARDCPYGSSETYKIGAPTSAADYHAARIAVKTLDEMTEYEYNVEYTDLITGRVWFSRPLWEPNTDWLKRKMEEAEANDRKLLNIPGSEPLEYSRRLVKRVKAGKVEPL